MEKIILQLAEHVGNQWKSCFFCLVLKMISAGLNLLQQLFRWNPNRNQIGLQKTSRPHPIPTTHECHVYNKQNEKRRWRSKNGSFSCLFFLFNQSIDIWRKSSEVVGGLVWNMLYFSIYWECHHPNWLIIFYFPKYILGMSSSQLTHIFQRGRAKKPPTSQPVICLPLWGLGSSRKWKVNRGSGRTANWIQLVWVVNHHSKVPSC